MSDEPDKSEQLGKGPAEHDPAEQADGDQAGEEQPRTRRRKHRRATRPATGGDPAADVPAEAGRDDTDAGWAPDAPESGSTQPAKRTSGRTDSAQDRWWREQRPPHWE